MSDQAALPAPAADDPATRLRPVADVPVRVRAVVGKARLTVAELLALGDGAVVPLDRRVGEPVDVYVNDRLVFRGEVVVADETLGVTIREVVGDVAAP